VTGNDAGDFFVRNARDGSIQFRIATALLRTLSVEVLRGLGMTRRRGAEVGGLLIGSEANRILTISELEIIPCEYAHGPSWLLSEADASKFAAAVARWGPHRGLRAGVIGWFRSHTRDGLRPDAADMEMFQRHFNGSQAALLLVKPYASRNAEAAVHLLDNRHTVPEAALEFEFGAAGAAVGQAQSETASAQANPELREISRPGRPPVHSLPSGSAERPAPQIPAVILPPDQSSITRTAETAAAPRAADESPRQESEGPAAAQSAGAADVPPEILVKQTSEITADDRREPVQIVSRDASRESPEPEPAPASSNGTTAAAPEPDRPLGRTQASPVRAATEKERLLQDVLGPREAPEHHGARPQPFHRDLFADYGRPARRPYAAAVSWTAAILAAVLFGSAIGYRQAGGNLAALIDSRPAKDAYSLGLATTLRGESILIQWDRDAAAIGKGLRGTVVISSATGRQEIQLEPEELRHGVLLYKTDAAETRIRLEVFLTPGRLVAEQTVWRRTEAPKE
jgi:hypothetical protein